MRKTKLFTVLLLSLVFVGAATWAVLCMASPLSELGWQWLQQALPEAESYEARARRHFCQHNSGEKPLNWRLAEVAEEFHEKKPMGQFILHSNDCSDFTDAIADEALGYKARFNRDSNEHVAANMRDLWMYIYWDGAEPLIPGDMISVRHSPWYPPDPNACSHVGMLGTDGMVYDWTKLKSWKQPRYGCNSVKWFIHNCSEPGQIRVYRLRPQYRYCIRHIPESPDI